MRKPASSCALCTW
ncbi:hypothetical protein FOT72_03250 [Citrobacter amalonaticus]|uniref:Uncharacterized protein n=1 Tax=Citrobacter amalonaticus TaxID=35703 RepID=A0A8I0MHK4_CITAM|nr:hypothetical protein [Citrobacter amalonaticus]HAU5636782.1 hypothetical protein [Citrobacter amalonaticus]